MRPRRNGSSGRTGPSYSTEPGASTASSSLARRNRSVETCRALAAAMLAVGAAPARALLRPAPSSPRPRHGDHQRHGVHLRPRRQALHRPRRLRRTPPHGAPHSARAHSRAAPHGRGPDPTSSASRPQPPDNELILLRFSPCGQTSRRCPARARLTDDAVRSSTLHNKSVGIPSR